MGTIVDD